MPRVHSVQNSFVAGELDPLLVGRTDIKHYFQGCELARNVFLLPQGGARRRPGLEYIDTLPTVVADGSLSESRCISFEFSTTQTYKLIFSDLKISVYLGKTLQATITTPWYSADLAKLTFTQSLDTMLIFHEDYPVQKLVRGASHTIWTLSALAFDAIPNYRFTPVDSNPAATLTPSAITGTVDLTASAGVFTSADVGQYISGNGGYARIVSYTSATVVKAYVITPFWDVTAIAAGSWTLESGYEPAWSATRGYPRTGTFHQSRLVIGGSRDLPQSLWFSKIDLFFDFDLGTNLDDEGIALTLDTDEVSAINAIFSGRHLQIYTSNAEFFVPTYTSGGSVITPNSIEVRRATRNGSIEGLRVHNVDGATMFVNRSGGALREFLYIDTEQSYASSNMSLLSAHLIRTPVDTAFRKATSTEDADYMLIVNSDGTLAMLNTLRDQELNGWSLQETDGLFKSCAVELDTMFFVVERTLNGVTSRFIEYFDDKHSLDNSFYTTAGLPTDTFTGLSRFDGLSIEVVADGARLPNVTVASGTAVISRNAETEVELGLNFVQTGDSTGDGYKVKTMPVDTQLPDGTMIGRKKRVVEITAQVDSTQSLKLNDNVIGFRQIGGALLDVSPIPFTGYKVAEGLLGFSDKGYAEVGDDVPLPATINSLAYKLAV